MTEHQLHVQRRYNQPLPSRSKHALIVACCLAVIFGAGFILTSVFGKADDAKVTGVVALDPLPLPPAADTLDGESGALPDLLGDVPEGTNPTDLIDKPKLDALGNPIDETPSIADDSPPAQKPPISSGPRVITIDGQPIEPGDSALVPAPITGLTRISTYGQVPAISTSGMTPLTAYKRPFSLPAGKKPVSVIIGGLGVNRGLTQQAIDELPAAVTLSFAAHSQGLKGWVNLARAKGHEVLIELPLESASFEPAEPGADRALMATRNVNANPRNLDWQLSRAQGFFGVTNYNGDVFLTRADVAAPLLDKLAKSGLSFIFDGSVRAPSLSALSSTAKLPYAQGHSLIDRAQDTALIQAELTSLSDAARRGAEPIGVGFAYPETISAVKSWTLTLSGQGLVLAPASSALK